MSSSSCVDKLLLLHDAIHHVERASASASYEDDEPDLVDEPSGEVEIDVIPLLPVPILEVREYRVKFDTYVFLPSLVFVVALIPHRSGTGDPPPERLTSSLHASTSSSAPTAVIYTRNGLPIVCCTRQLYTCDIILKGDMMLQPTSPVFQQILLPPDLALRLVFVKAYKRYFIVFDHA